MINSSEDQFFFGSENPGDPGEGAKIVVTVKFLKKDFISISNSGFDLLPHYYGQSYGPGTSYDISFLSDAGPSASDIVSNLLKGLAVVLDGAKVLAYPFFPAKEYTKLSILADTLHKASDGVKAGNIDFATAKSMVATSLTAAFDVGNGALTGLILSSLGGVAVKASGGTLGIVGSAGLTAGMGAVGLALDAYMSEKGLSQFVANHLTELIFDGSQALAEGIKNLVDKVKSGIGYFNEQLIGEQGYYQFQSYSTGQFGDFDNDSANGGEYQLLLWNGHQDIMVSSNPDYVPNRTGPGPKEVPGPITGAPIADDGWLSPLL